MSGDVWWCLVDMNAIRFVFIGFHDMSQPQYLLKVGGVHRRRQQVDKGTTRNPRVLHHLGICSRPGERHDANLHGLFATYQAFTLFAAGCDLRLRQIWPTEFRHPCSFYQEIQEVIVQRLGRPRTQISAANDLPTRANGQGVGIPSQVSRTFMFKAWWYVDLPFYPSACWL